MKPDLPLQRVDLGGIPETMLWTLYNRASFARSNPRLLDDPHAPRILDAIDLDAHTRFGPPSIAHALRSRMFDDRIRPWMAAHPGGTVVELGCGLETTFLRCDDSVVQWRCIDVPEAIATRQRLLPASRRCRHIPCSALDPEWIRQVDASKGVLISAQGLLMYFHSHQVQLLLQTIAARIPEASIVFDTIPPWFSKRTLRGFQLTGNYQTPAMPWGIKRRDIPDTLLGWLPTAGRLELVKPPFGAGSFKTCLLALSARTALIREYLPWLVAIDLGRSTVGHTRPPNASLPRTTRM